MEEEDPEDLLAEVGVVEVVVYLMVESLILLLREAPLQLFHLKEVEKTQEEEEDGRVDGLLFLVVLVLIPVEPPVELRQQFPPEMEVEAVVEVKGIVESHLGWRTL